MRKLAPSPIAVRILVVAASSALVAIGACANPDTQTPACNDNVKSFGVDPSVTNGCEGFAPCSLPPLQGGSQASGCCVDADGGALSGNDLASCLHGYGDSTCPYLCVTTTMMGTNMYFQCSSTPCPTGSGTGGSGTGGGGTGASPKDGGGDG